VRVFWDRTEGWIERMAKGSWPAWRLEVARSHDDRLGRLETTTTTTTTEAIKRKGRVKL
jgi:hypothetical protein